MLCQQQASYFKENYFQEQHFPKALSRKIPNLKVSTKFLCITAQKENFPVSNFFSKCEQIRRKLWICSLLLENFIMQNLIFRTVHL